MANLPAILDKAEHHAENLKFDPSVLGNARLSPDMHNLAVQVQFVTVHAKGVGGRLSGIEVPVYENSEISISDLQVRPAKTSAFLRGLTATQIHYETAYAILRHNGVDIGKADYLGAL